MIRFGILFWMVVLAFWGTGCKPSGDLPEPGSEAYREAVSAFFTGVAAIEVGESLGAEGQLIRVTEIAPQEPAAWINLSVLAMRQNDFDLAAERLAIARKTAPENAIVTFTEGRLASTLGNSEEAIVQYRRALELDPNAVKVAYALSQELMRIGGTEVSLEVQAILEEILVSHPENLAVLMELARIAVELGDAKALQRTLSRIASDIETFPPEAVEQIRVLEEALARGDIQSVEENVVFLRNMLVQLPRFRQDLAEVQIPPEEMAEILRQFIRLPNPTPRPAPPDTTLTLSPNPLPFVDSTSNWVGIAVFSAEETPTMIFANNQMIRPREDISLFFPGEVGGTPTPHAIEVVDFNSDYRMDLVASGSAGLRLYVQDEEGFFTDITAQTGLPSSIRDARYTDVWSADLDLEGDMDLIIGVPDEEPLVLRNNADGTFTPIHPFEGVRNIRGFTWSDWDADGDPDATLLDTEGSLHFFSNLRGGLFHSRREPIRNVAAVTTTDINSDSILDLLLLKRDGSVERVSYMPGEGNWEQQVLSRWPGQTVTLEPGESRLFSADLDNNGALDLIATRPYDTFTWLGNEQNELQPHQPVGQVFTGGVADLTGDGRLDLLGIRETGESVLISNRGEIEYHWKELRTRAAEVFGDQRINSFGVGGEMEIRSGLLYQKQVITNPVVHFGLGTHTEADVARIIWPNGNVQAEFDLESGQAVLASQRLKGSCPWVFTNDGEKIRFVTDFLWRSPLGLKINAQETAGVETTEDWIKIRSDQLKPVDGYYDIRITAELWETHFFDHVSLLVVDHPAETEIYVDERFVFPPPEMKVHQTSSTHAIERALDQEGNDVTELVRAIDQRYLGGFEKGYFQGVASDHFVEIHLGPEVPEQSAVLIANGWLRPTDSSINVALSQGQIASPEGLRLEIPDGKGGWRVAKNNLGCPAGKTKTILIDLHDLFEPGEERRLRLGTSMEIYWDAFFWATSLPDTGVKTERLLPDTAELRYRGFSLVTEANRESPEVPHYEKLKGTSQFWRDLEGYYTRFGDVSELLEVVDDRYVIMNAGDELIFRFKAPEDPPAGWNRDYVLIGDGWEKDGDYNTMFSATVLPLPSHTDVKYNIAPGRLEDDPVFRAHPEDWKKYHTRYVDSDRFQRALTARR